MPLSFSMMFNLVLVLSFFVVALTFLILFRLLERRHPVRDAAVSALLFFVVLVGLRYLARAADIGFLEDSFYLFGMLVYMAFLASVLTYAVGWVVVLDNRLQLWCIAVLTLVLFSVGVYDAHSLEVSSIVVTSEKLDADYNIVFFSDVHLGSESRVHFEKVISRVVSLDPDIVLIGGDIVDSRRVTKEDMQALDALHVPVFLVYGNHDGMVNSSSLLNSRVRVLDDELLDLDSLELIGLNYRRHRDDAVGATLESMEMNSSKFRILLLHAPIAVEEAAGKGIDLMLSGHTHGGQVFPYHLVHKADFGYLYGLYHVDGMELFVSSGAGVWGPDFRFGSENEIVRIALRKNV